MHSKLFVEMRVFHHFNTRLFDLNLLDLNNLFIFVRALLFFLYLVRVVLLLRLLGEDFLRLLDRALVLLRNLLQLLLMLLGLLLVLLPLALILLLLELVVQLLSMLGGEVGLRDGVTE